jgi:hypothetical protein
MQSTARPPPVAGLKFHSWGDNMNRIACLIGAITGKTRQLLDAVQSKLGLVPNLVQCWLPPGRAGGLPGIQPALAGGRLDAQCEQIA